MANTNDKDDLKPKTTCETTDDRAMAHRAGLEECGRFGTVSWTNEDIVEALQERGIDATTENVAAVRQHFFVEHIDDRMTEAGWAVIDDAISDLGLAPRSSSDKSGE